MSVRWNKSNGRLFHSFHGTERWCECLFRYRRQPDKNLLHTLTRCVNAWAHDRRKYFLRIVHIQMNIVSAHLVNRSGVSIEISSKSVFKNNNIKARISIMHCVHVISCSNANTKKHKHFFFIWIVYHSFSFSLPVYLSSTVIAKCISHCETVNL